MAAVKNWSKFQHFKDRRPPWIKLYRDILDDPQWHKLDPVAAKTLVMFWLIASENEGELPDIETLAFRVRKTEAEVVDVLEKLSHWLSDDRTISPRYQDETVAEKNSVGERETEGETETELTNPNGLVVEPTFDAMPAGSKKPKPPDCPHQSIIDLYHETLPLCPRVLRWTPDREKHLRSRWREIAVEKGWQNEADGMAWWRKFFGFVSESKFLTGRINGRDGKPPFVADLEWITKPSNFTKIIEGKYG